MALSMISAALFSYTMSGSPLLNVRSSRALPNIRMESGPPQIDWQQGEVVANVPVARGTSMITIKGAEPLKYAPGHILGLELVAEEEKDANGDDGTPPPLRGAKTKIGCLFLIGDCNITAA